MALQTTKHIGEISYKLPKVREGEELLAITQSVCPYCYRILPSIVVERDGKVYIRRICPEHGEIEDLYYGDVEIYKKMIKWDIEGRGARHIYTPVTRPCPFNCGLCPMHKQHSALVNIVLTNRCNLSCWYCFFYAEAAGYVYEPTIEQIVSMVRQIKKQGIAVNVQLTGGEPTLREDLVDIVKALKAEGVRHLQLNTNGIKFSELYWEDPAKAVEYARALRTSGVNTIYLSFDGVSPVTNWKNHWEIPYMFEVFRKARMTSIVLVPTVINNVNTHEMGAIVRFAAKHVDIVRAVNFQPVSLTGMMKKHERARFRITIPDVIKLIEEQTDGEVPREAWFPIPVSAIFSRFIEAFAKEFKFEMANHPMCGAGTYVYVERRSDGTTRLVPITNFVDVEGLLEYLKDKWEELLSGSTRLMVGMKILYSIRKFIDQKRAPEGFDLYKMLLNIIIRRNYEALGELHYKMVFLGMMHFMDLYNYDIQRVQRCNIHYATPDGRLIPFCAFNIFEDIYRDKIQREYGIPLEEYSKKHGLPPKVITKKYIRNRRLLESTEIYKKAYEGIIELTKR
ncbi:tetraether lipid synthase Tes [Staphylothermus hellenicus]|uniref:Radical SAM domain protein n=1 Tax=Staphylothermus hellenicus (strain DSM 12710 / JCM 10830 / BK20S6-10-b1 / P8) TaxID=591019 RepID=D7DAF9_STAHD|nr:radical SAM protein [Staphylothermus hellenicus]ADI31156.1 Radical SAM domain protein [Staphylothermus hellenicus DSM 12710]